jgi:hypothetical protein
MDIAEQTVRYAGSASAAPADTFPPPQPPPDADTFTAAMPADPSPTAVPRSAPRDRQRTFRARLGEFRRRRVLVPHGDNGAALTVEMHGARWLLAFTDEPALARYARARGETDRNWRYRTVWGAAVLDAGVPAVAGTTGLPCGVLVDAGDGERGLVLPPVTGIVPDAVAVDRPPTETELRTGEGRP